MTDAGRQRRNISDELTRAEQALRAAEALLDLGLFADSVSRSYYAAYHYLRGLLHSRGLEPKTHAGAIHVFNTEFVRTGRFRSANNRLLSGMQGSRELADYDAAVSFSESDARAQLDEARAFGGEVMSFLAAEGWLT